MGRVLDQESRQPVEAVEVRLIGEQVEFSQLTTGRGEFIFAQVAAGAYELVVDHLAYGTRSDSIEVGAGELVNIEVWLQMRPIEMEPLAVTVQRRRLSPRTWDFYDRLERGWGHFITWEEIEQRRPARVSHMIGEMPGVRLFYARAGGHRIAFRRYGRYCRPALYLDGISISGDWSVDDLVLPDDVEGIEVYRGPATAPPVFTGSTAFGCVVVAIWTRSAPSGEVGSGKSMVQKLAIAAVLQALAVVFLLAVF